jgi:hypothetical protein
LPLAGNHPEWIRPLLSQDPFALANLDAEVSWGYGLIIPGILFLIAVCLGFILLKKQKNQQAILLILIACIFSMQVLLTLFAPRIEQYSQHAAIAFYQSIKGKSVYVATVGFKSYAHYFYAAVDNDGGVVAKSPEWILNNQLDRPAYLVSKITNKDQLLKDYPSLQILYEKNGFVFYKK